MKICLAAVTLIGATLVGGAAQADEITTLTLNDVATNDGGSLTGSFQLDDNTFLLSNINISFSGTSSIPSQTFTSTSSVPAYCQFCNPTNEYDEFRIGQGSTTLYFDITDPLVLNGVNALISDPTNTNNYSDADYTNVDSGDIDQGLSGELDAATTNVPEPLTLSLFGAGLAGAVAMRRRKKKTTAKA